MNDEKKKKPAARREDRAGHLDPRYAASLRAQGGAARDDGHAFIDASRSGDDLAEELGEEAVAAMTRGEDGLTDDRDAEVAEELGGPFVESSGAEEFAEGTDASNPADAEREPFPKT